MTPPVASAAWGLSGIAPFRTSRHTLEDRAAKGHAMSKMTLRTEGDRRVVVTRRFAAFLEAVYRAHTEPLLIQKWLLGPDGWTMPVCVNKARPGGRICYEWTDGKGGGFHLTGEYLELVAVQPDRSRGADAP